MKKKGSRTARVGSYLVTVSARKAYPPNRKRDHAILTGIRLVLSKDGVGIIRANCLRANSYSDNQKGMGCHWNIVDDEKDLFLAEVYAKFPKDFNFDAITADFLKRIGFKEADNLNFYFAIKGAAERSLEQIFPVPHRRRQRKTKNRPKKKPRW